MKRLSSRIAVLVAALAFGLAAQTAHAEPENPIVTGSMEVQIVGGGKVTGTGIDCGNGANDCSQSASWRDNELPPTNRLTATANAGWGFLSWSNCTPLSGQRCDAIYTEFDPNTVTARFLDVQAPTVFLQTPAANAVAGNSVEVSVSTTDNDRVARVEYLIDGQVRQTAGTAPWGATLDLAGIPEGEHLIQARSFDPTGNNGITAARTILVDHTGPQISLTAPLSATNALRPQFSFTSTSADLRDVGCVIQKKGDDGNYSPCTPGTWFSGDAPEEGEWQFALWANDNVGNLTQVVHDFVVDRTAPTAAFTSGPADGSEVEPGQVRYEWTAADGLPVTQACAWDGGETFDCEGSAARSLTEGTHAFRVSIVDRAGNETVLNRTFTVKKDGQKPPPDPDPDPVDRTGPVVKLVAPKQKLKAVRKALRLNVRCDEACRGSVVVKGAKGVRYTARVNLARAGVSRLKMKPSTKVRKRLHAIGGRKRRSTPLKLTATATLKDKAGNTGRARLRFRVNG